MQESRRTGISLFPAAMVLVLAWSLGCSPPAPSSLESAVTILPKTEEGPPLDFRIILLSPEERRAKLAEHMRFCSEHMKQLLTPRLCRNPIVANGQYVEIEIKNTSGRAIDYYPESGPFGTVGALVFDQDGKRALFSMPFYPGYTRLGDPMVLRLPRFGQDPGVERDSSQRRRVATLKPGEVVRHSFYHLGSLSSLYKPIKPGTYTVRAICVYYRAPDGKNCKVESEPLLIVIVTRDDIREDNELWEKFYDY